MWLNTIKMGASIVIVAIVQVGMCNVMSFNVFSFFFVHVLSLQACRCNFNQLKLLHQIAENEQTLYLLCINFRHLHLVIYLFVPRPTCANEKR